MPPTSDAPGNDSSSNEPSEWAPDVPPASTGDGHDAAAARRSYGQATSTDGDVPKTLPIGIHYVTNRRGAVRARLHRTHDGEDRTEGDRLLRAFPHEEPCVWGTIRTSLDMGSLFAEGLFADRSLDEMELDDTYPVEREHGVPIVDGAAVPRQQVVDGLQPDDTPSDPEAEDDDDDTVLHAPDAVRVAIHFVTNRRGTVQAELTLDDVLTDQTDVVDLIRSFDDEDALVCGKVRTTLNLAALFADAVTTGAVDPGTIYMPPADDA